jgi:hypothetical protein
VTTRYHINCECTFIINYVLKGKLKNYKNNVSPSIFGVINKAASDGAGKAETGEVLAKMSYFLKTANTRIENKINELLGPIQKQKDAILRNINMHTKIRGVQILPLQTIYNLY